MNNNIEKLNNSADWDICRKALRHFANRSAYIFRNPIHELMFDSAYDCITSPLVK